jgi:hypothetical protein
MEQYEQIISVIALTMGASWASGINLYAVILVLGIGGMTGQVPLPSELQAITNPFVIGAAGLMYMVEFVTDKIPGIDTGWDAVHTFIRIPSGALLAYGAVGDVGQPVALAAAIIGGSITAGTHATKSGSRVMINASPEPFTNWAVSIGEDIAVVAGLWTALKHPLIFIGLLICFIIFMIWLLPRIWRGIKKIFGFIGRLFGTKKEGESEEEQKLSASDSNVEVGQNQDDIEKKLEQLDSLLKKDLITQEEYQKKKQDLLERL